MIADLQMVNPFRIPYRSVETPRDKIITILVFGLFIFLFLFLFKPFGMTGLKPEQQLFISFGFGLVTAFVLIVFKYLLEPFLRKKDWSLGASILWDISIASSIGIANYFFMNIVFHQPFIFKYLLFSIWTAILVGSIPVTLTYIISINKVYREALVEAAISPEKVLWEEEVVLRAGNPRNELKLNPREIVYLTSNDNYVTVVTYRDGKQEKVTIRGTLKAAGSELEKNRRFMRCHKCYLVNLDFADFIKGGHQNMTIKLLNFETEIPVSRSLADAVSKLVKGS